MALCRYSGDVKEGGGVGENALTNMQQIPTCRNGHCSPRPDISVAGFGGNLHASELDSDRIQVTKLSSFVN